MTGKRFAMHAPKWFYFYIAFPARICRIIIGSDQFCVVCILFIAIGVFDWSKFAIITIMGLSLISSWWLVAILFGLMKVSFFQIKEDN